MWGSESTRLRKAMLSSLLAVGLAATGGVGVASAAPADSVTVQSPPGRAFERVSPADKPSGAMAGLNTELMAMPGRSADIGERLIYGATTPLSESESGVPNPLIFGERTATGWRSSTLTRSTDHGNSSVELIQNEARVGWMNHEGNALVFASGRLLGETMTPLGPGHYRVDDGPEGANWLTRPRDGFPWAPGILYQALSASEDLRRVIFQSSQPLMNGAPPAGTTALYMIEDGEMSIIGRAPVTNEVLANAQTANSAYIQNPQIQNTTPARSMRNELAGDGRFMLFVAPGSTGATLYVRDLDSGVTRQITNQGGIGDARQLRSSNVDVGIATVPDGFVFGARKAPRAFFKALKADNFNHETSLVEANLETGEIVMRSAINGLPVALSPDGERMLFIEPPPPPRIGDSGDWTLRYWHRANPNTNIAVATINSPVNSPPYGLIRAWEPSPDGDTWTFVAIGNLDPERENSSPLTRQLYRWTVGQGAPTCLSCESVDGVARTSGANLAVQDASTSESFLNPLASVQTVSNGSKPMLAQPPHGPSQDGRYLLFDSPDRLVARDTNDVRDVYLWDRDGGPNGKLYLLTSGRGNTPSWALDLSPDGKNAFFSTREGLVPGDDDRTYDVYTARIGNGFPDSPESCTGTGCRADVSPAPKLPLVGSSLVIGNGNVVANPSSGTPSVRVKRLKAVAGPMARLQVRLPQTGRVVIRGRGIRTSSRSVSKAGVVTVRVSLAANAKKALRRRGSLRTSARVSFRAADGQVASKRLALIFKQPKVKRSGSSNGKGGR